MSYECDKEKKQSVTLIIEIPNFKQIKITESS